jgi:aminopeptidase N
MSSTVVMRGIWAHGRVAALLLAPLISPAPALAVTARDSLLAPGVSHALARHRARTLRDVRYDLALDLVPLDSAIGRVTVRFNRLDQGDAILDYRGRRLASAEVNGRPLPSNAAHQGHLVIPAAELRRGENRVRLDFIADVAPSGASIIRSHDPTDGRDYLYTLLVPADASQLFPCFDQPDLKARVRLAVTAPAGWTVVSNGATASTDTAGRRVTTRFAETRPISTYLIAFAAGPWQRASAVVSGRTITAYVRRSRAGEADLDTLLALNGRALRWMEHWFGRPYPFGKFDFVLAPAFPFGGMEHPGAVFYSEDGFIFRERPTLPRRLARFSTILHEVAHQWFGDLVTMRWFDDLWLKEGFATFMATKALAALEPDAGAWKTFYLGNKPSAYAVDQTPGTRPLWQALDNLDQAKSNYGAIVYNKAPSVLKQLDHLVGDSAFQLGVRRFLELHAYGSADWRDLLGAIGSAAGRPLDRFGRDFMLRPGVPVVEQRVSVRDGRIARLALAQTPAVPRRVLDAALGGDSSGSPAPQPDKPPRAAGSKDAATPAVEASDAPWTERTEVLLAYRDRPPVRIPVELSDTLTVISAAAERPAPEYVFANAGDYGYFLLLLDSSSVRALESGAVGRVRDGLLRAMLWGGLWDQVRAARLPPERFARLVLRELPAEADEQIVPVLLARLGRAVAAYLGPERRAAIQPALERVLWSEAEDSGRPYGLRKACTDAFIELAATPNGLRRLEGLLAADSVAGEPLREPTRWDIVTRLLELGAAGSDRLYAEQSRRDTTADGRRRAFIAAAARPSAATKREYFTRWFADSSLSEQWASGSLGPFNSLDQQALTLPYLRPALDSLPFIQAHRRIFFLESWLGAFLRGQTGQPALETVRGWLADHPGLALDLRRKVLQHADELDRTVRIRAAWGAP